MMTITGKYFRHSDLSLISALVTLGFFIDSIDTTDPQRAVFSIKRTEGLDEAIEAYWNDHLRLNPRKYALVSKGIKSRLFNELKEKNNEF